MWRPIIATVMWYHRDSHNGQHFAVGKRFIPLLLVFVGLFTVFFYRAGQILHYRVELSRMRFVYRACQEKLKALKNNISDITQNCTVSNTISKSSFHYLLKDLTGTKTATGFDDLKPFPLSNFILPHLTKDPQRLRPSYHMSSERELVDIVIGITNVKRDKESYLIGTMKDLVNGISEEEKNSTLIIVLVGESDLKYVINTTWTIEKQFPKEVKSGLIQVISPSDSYYPNLDSLPPSLGDSRKRVKWRSKEVLDVLYLMAYGNNKGSYYLMMEDDVSAVKSYMKGIKNFIAFCSAQEPEWVMIEFSHHFGSLGKLFKSSDVGHFLIFLQLFYHNMPLDFLIESYLKDKACDLARTSNECFDAVMKIRKKYPAPIFRHIGLYSSLAGKIGKVKDPQFAKGHKFFPHINPPLKKLRSDIEAKAFHTLKMAYEGRSMFLGLKPKCGDHIEFWFEKPTALKSYKFQTGNYERKHDTLVHTEVQVRPVGAGNFTTVGSFDELGHAEGEVASYGPLDCIRLKVVKVKDNTARNVVISEIELVPVETGDVKSI